MRAHLLLTLALQSACTLSGSLPCANDSECAEGLRCVARFREATDTPDASDVVRDVVRSSDVREPVDARGVDARGDDARVDEDVRLQDVSSGDVTVDVSLGDGGPTPDIFNVGVDVQGVDVTVSDVVSPDVVAPPGNCGTLNSLRDDFSSSLAVRWYSFSGSGLDEVAISNNGLEIPHGGLGQVSGISSIDTYEFADGSGVSIEIPQMPSVANFELNFEVTSSNEHVSFRVGYENDRWQIDRSTDAVTLVSEYPSAAPDILRIRRVGNAVALEYRIQGESLFHSEQTPYTFSDDWGRVSVLASSRQALGEAALQIASVNTERSEVLCTASSFRETFAETQSRVSQFWETVIGGSDTCFFSQLGGQGVIRCQHQEGEIYAAMQSSALDFENPQDLQVHFSGALTTPPLERSCAIEDVESGMFIDVSQNSSGFFYFSNIDETSHFLPNPETYDAVIFRRTSSGVSLVLKAQSGDETLLADLPTSASFARTRLRLELDAADIPMGLYEARFEGVNIP